MKSRKIKEESEGILLVVVITQIFLLMTLAGANSYIINQSDFSNVNKTTNKEDETKDLIISGMDLLISFLSIKQIGFVSADDSDTLEVLRVNGCCEKLKDSEGGAFCQEISSANVSLCEDGKYITGVLCGNYDLCKSGVFYHERTGTCSTGPKLKFQDEEDVEFFENKNLDEVNECTPGCCTIGLRKFLDRTKKQCQIETGSDNVDFDIGVSWKDCKYVNPDETGACVVTRNSGIKDCSFTTRKDCERREGNFKPEFLCTAQKVGEICEPTEQTECGQDDKVYFKDSCGNRANVYDASKIVAEGEEINEYWKKVVTSDLCDDGNGNVNNSACGNCDTTKSSFCTEAVGELPDYGDFICGDQSCTDEDGKRWKNRESWCVYEGSIGGSRDVVGSSHRMRSCRDGKIINEIQSEERQHICASKIETLSNGETFSVAQLRPNLWKSCFAANISGYFDSDGKRLPDGEGSDIQEGRDSCEAIPDCKVQKISLGNVTTGGFNYTVIENTIYLNEQGQEISDFNVSECQSNPNCRLLSTSFETLSDPNNPKKMNVTYLNKQGEESTKQEFERIKGECVSDDNCRLVIKTIKKSTVKGSSQESLSDLRTECENTLGCSMGPEKYEPIGSRESFFMFDRCVPKYPPGFEHFDQSKNQVEGKNFCELAGSVACPLVESKTWTFFGLSEGDWEVHQNGECLSDMFIEQMNDYCKSLGDCGAYVNVAGDYEKNFNVRPNQSTPNFDASKFSSLPDSKVSEYEGYATVGSGSGEIPKFINPPSDSGDPGRGHTSIHNLTGAPDAHHTDFWLAMSIAAGGALVLALFVTEGAVLTFFTGFFGKIGAFLFGPGAAPLLASIGPFLLLVVVIFIIVFFFSHTEYRVTDIEFTCQSWKAPPGGDKCELCNSDPKRPCNEYKCRSLGRACEIISSDDLFESNESVCFNSASGDVTAPIIKFKSIENQRDYGVKKIFSSGKERGIEINSTISSNEGKIPEFTPIDFSLEIEGTSRDVAECVYTWKREDYLGHRSLDYSNATHTNKGNTGDSLNHRINFVLERGNPGFIEKGGDTIGGKYGEINLFIRCMDLAGNVNVEEYGVKIFMKGEKNLNPAVIKSFSPEDESYLAFEVNESDLSIELDKPAQCRWDDKDKIYEDMENTFSCDDYVVGETRLHWNCNTKLTDLTEPRNSVYIRCNTTNNITNEQSQEYVLFSTEDRLEIHEQVLSSTENHLRISSKDSQREFIFGGSPLRGDLSVITRGGAYEGNNATCHYRFITPFPYNISSRSVPFPEPEGTLHRQHFIDLRTGNYNISVFCEDKAKNNVTENFDFKLVVDDKPPQITRAFKKDGNLKIWISEESICYYHTNSSSPEFCSFELNDSLEDVSKTVDSFSKEHSIRGNSFTYYIRCKDKWNNTLKNKCGIIAYPVDFV